MKLNHIFSYIAHNTASTQDRKDKYRLLRQVLAIRKSFQLENDVKELVKSYSLFKTELCGDFSEKDVKRHLGDFMEYPQVKSLLDDVEETDMDDETETEEEDADYSTDADDETDSEESEDENVEQEDRSYLCNGLMFGIIFANLAVSVATLYTVVVN